MSIPTAPAQPVAPVHSAPGPESAPSPAPAPASALANPRGFFARASEGINPIVLQEVRRGLRTRVFSIAFTLLLLACAVIALVAFGVYEPGNSGVGQGTFVAVLACLSIVGFFMLPYSAYRSLSREREDKTWPLLVLTGMSPRRILSGKIGSTLLQALLYASAIAPFLLFAYLLQGVSLVTVGAVLGAALSFHVFLTVAAVTVATLGETRVVRGALHFLVLGALLFAGSSAFGYGTAMVFAHSASDVTAFLTIAGVGSWMLLSYGLVLFAVAVSRLTFESDNHAFWPRLALLLHFVGNVALCHGIELLSRPHAKEMMGTLLGTLGVIHAFAAGVFVATGRPGLSRRVRENPPRLNPLGLLVPGAVRGLSAANLLVLSFAGAGLALLALAGCREEKYYAGIALMAAFALLYLSFPVALGRGPLRLLLPGPAFLQVLAVLVFVVAVGVPPLVALIGDFKVDDPIINFLNPVVMVVHCFDDGPDEAMAAIGVLALGAWYVAHRVSADRDREADALLALATPAASATASTSPTSTPSAPSAPSTPSTPSTPPPGEGPTRG
ncbi:MAG: hypothetical protein QM765_34260 [Myxococcales bacterium]